VIAAVNIDVKVCRCNDLAAQMLGDAGADPAVSISREDPVEILRVEWRVSRLSL